MLMSLSKVSKFMVNFLSSVVLVAIIVTLATVKLKWMPEFHTWVMVLIKKNKKTFIFDLMRDGWQNSL